MLGKTLVELFDQAVSQHREKIAFKESENTMTYEELGEAVNNMASLLIETGIERGDRVAVWLENGLEYVVMDFALIKVGATRVLMNTYLSNDEIAYRIKDSQAKLLIAEEKYREQFESITEQVGYEFNILTNGGPKKTNYLLYKGDGKPISVPITEDDLTLIMYTGGTTGRSKGVKHTHKTVVAIMFSEIIEMDIERNVNMLHVAPLPHASGFLVFPGLVRGGKQVIQKSFDAKKFCQTVEQEKISFSFLVPTMIYMILDLEKKHQYDFSSLKTIVYGAAPMAPSRIREAVNLFGNVLLQIYSQAEVANQTTVLSKSDHQYALENDESILSSCGKSILMSEVKIMNQGKECQTNEVGEIVTRGPHVMKGYWRMEEETKKTIKQDYLHTGDLAYMDEKGFVYLVDRKNDMIISGGFNVYTTVVEKVLFDHPDVLQATVIGVPDERWGEKVKAFVVLKNDLTEEALLNFCKKKLSKYEVPKSVEFVEELPLTAYGKIDKKRLRAPYWDKQNRQVN